MFESKLWGIIHGRRQSNTQKRLFNLLVRSFYPNLVKDKTAPASADADPDARALHAVGQPIQAYQQPLNKLTDDAIIQAHREKTARLSLERGKRVKGKCYIKLFSQQILPSGRMRAICVEMEDDFASHRSSADSEVMSRKTRDGFSEDNLSLNECGGIATSTTPRNFA